MTQNQSCQFEETHGVVGFPSVCQFFFEGYPAKFCDLFADRETETQSGRVVAAPGDGPVWQGRLPEWFISEHIR